MLSFVASRMIATSITNVEKSPANKNNFFYGNIGSQIKKNERKKKGD
jgi:hypothetical protein